MNDVGVGQHRALGPARRAGRVENDGNVVLVAGGLGDVRERAGPVDPLLDRVDRDQCGVRHAARIDQPFLDQRAFREEKRRAAVARDVLDLGRAGAHVERHGDRAQPDGGDEQRDEVPAVRDHDHHAIARRHAQPAHRRGDPVGAPPQLPEGQPRLAVDHGLAVGEPVEDMGQHRMEVRRTLDEGAHHPVAPELHAGRGRVRPVGAGAALHARALTPPPPPRRRWRRARCRTPRPACFRNG